MTTLTFDLEKRILALMEKAGSKFQNPEELLNFALDLAEDQVETKSQRLERTKKDLNAWIDDRLKSPSDDFETINIDAIKSDYARKR